MFQRIGSSAFKKDLTNILALTEARGNPHRAYPTIHVAGTNGKGSVSSMLTSILMEAGYKTGLLTSPHLRSFTERMRVNGIPIPENEVVNFVESHKDLIETLKPSFFEATVLMAFEYFMKEKVEIAVIEVGMGGRLDSTNIISPETTAITNISRDHSQFLGETLPLIAGEKAGIIKEGVDVIIGQYVQETKPVFEKIATEKGAKLILADQRFRVQRIDGDLKSQSFSVEDRFLGTNQILHCDLSGHYQRWNIPTVLAIVESFKEKGWQIPAKAIEKGIANASKNSGFIGRMSLLRENPSVITDIAHNEAGVDEVLAQIEQIDYKQLHIVWGMVGDKDIGKVMQMLPKSAHYYFVKPNVPRGLDLASLKTEANRHGLQGSTWPSVELGYAAALSAADKDDLIYVGGSTFVVAEVI